MAQSGEVFRRDPIEKKFKVVQNVGICIFIDAQSCGSVPDK
jgi:hypothetical protein